MSFPDSLITETPTPVAEEILRKLSDDPDVSEGLRFWLSHLRGDVRNARAQDSLMGLDG
jgi:hypothetical protein